MCHLLEHLILEKKAEREVLKSRPRDLSIEIKLLWYQQGTDTLARLRAETKASTCVAAEKDEEKLKEKEKLQVTATRSVLVEEKTKILPRASSRIALKKKEKVRVGGGRRVTCGGH